MSSGSKKKVAPSPPEEEHPHISLESVFYDCAPPKPNRLSAIPPEPPARRPKLTEHRSESVSTTKMEKDSLLGNSRETLKMSFSEAKNGESEFRKKNASETYKFYNHREMAGK
jgi:hypothetical protein